ncbi:CotH kinase family protein [Mycolicibacterium phlei]|jgi:spore coat protein CotH|uniref:CotH kinase family protein n=1 Tax=Mycolicibacterium phlei TaxID=1771 RepID=UPI0037C96B73
MTDDDQARAGSVPRRRLVHRVPTRLRQYWKLLAVLAVVVVVLALVFGSTTIRPYITGDADVMASPITDNIAGTVDLFDPTVPHSLTVDITEAEYREMLSAFEKDGVKKWVTADITLDGTPISDVAVRLKGNSTLFGLRGDKFRPPGMPKDGGPPPGMSMMMALSAKPDDPTSLPLLISFNENAAGRGYQGLTELSVRPGTPVLNESLALSLTAATGQPSQRYTYATYTINGRTTTRLLLEHPDEGYANTLFDGAGYLYKADATSELKFVGTDQSAYAEQFKQLNSVETGNLQPVINFLQWLDNADAAEFDAHLGDWVDVDSFARYAATQNLLANGDDMAGPGQNYYLWYDLATKRFTVVSWDLNLAMLGNETIGPHDPVKMPMPPMPSGGPPPGAPPFGSKGLRFGNPLKDRFLASPAFTAVYETAYWDLYDEMFASGLAHRTLDEIAQRIPLSDGLDEQTLTDAVDSMHRWIDERTAALAGHRRK